MKIYEILINKKNLKIAVVAPESQFGGWADTGVLLQCSKDMYKHGEGLHFICQPTNHWHQVRSGGNGKIYNIK